MINAKIQSIGYWIMANFQFPIFPTSLFGLCGTYGNVQINHNNQFSNEDVSRRYIGQGVSFKAEFQFW
ncbi:MAG: hypothetical protein A3G57_02590 [Candidatus Andersenbacteria bacterium RIFCSPLOWO2_12_FULL_45_8]|nr:MAG: hypothetical protein UW94_C0016G0015 [Parcubacteria group bacterium GW2011_GWA2_45_14]OGY33950.1 MAG: hypothetical protein A3B76_02115 [Candidatus Andersenbacteria bacterium RIFCSPHIGHO2_02_FULL_46_16]OGY38366.1 MAG: hypothetical protein A3G57_02590 [Candidatus Andersenbacteria bacterium RIFCSPLOWO2_12_FULL_45_8]HBE90268.1 hypothetical protein [Candidatus Andersenbacteria bacterium]